MKKILSVLFFALSLVSMSPALAQDVVVDSILPVDECAYINLTLKFGSKDSATSKEVAMLQKFLRNRGYMENLYTKLDAPDVPSYATFDDATRNGVKAFQKDYAMLVDGVVGSLSRRQIKALSCTHDSLIDSNISVLTQNNNEIYFPGDKVTVKWLNSPISSRDIRVGIYSMSKGKNMTINRFILDGSQQTIFTIPQDLPLGNYKVMVHEVLKDSIFGVSNAFTIKGLSNPTIDRVSGPSVLEVNKNGAWSVYTTNPNDGKLTFDIDWGDGKNTQLFDTENSQDIVFTHVYNEDNDFLINIKITDKYGKFAEKSTTVTVKGKEVLLPVIYGVSGSSNVDANKEYSWLVLASAPENETLKFFVDWGEGKTPEQDSALFYHTYNESGQYSVIFYAKSSGGGVATKEYKVKVMGAIAVPI
ncbi:MAG: peptidoglycan-binding domain-containing protein, partial [Patescibacteria group bacterium]